MMFTKDDVVHTYTAQQAIEDGELVEASPSTHPNCLLTKAVYWAIKRAEGFTDEDYGSVAWKQRVIPLLMDAVLTAKKHAGDWIYTGDELDGNLTGKRLWFAMNELGGLTIMFPEDY